jgi:hypothetical protein
MKKLNEIKCWGTKLEKNQEKNRKNNNQKNNNHIWYKNKNKPNGKVWNWKEINKKSKTNKN